MGIHEEPVASTHADVPVDRAVAYLVSEYPALSHVFIEREVRAMRALGHRVDVFSIRVPDRGAPFAPDTIEELRLSTSLRGRRVRDHVVAHFSLIARTPRAWWAGFAAALRAGRTPREKTWQVFYFGEAVLLERDLQIRSLSRLHAHFANNAADVARIAAAISQKRRRGVRVTWSLALHGPADFTIDRDLLAAKLTSASEVACISEYALGRAAEFLPDGQGQKLAIVRMTVDGARYRPMAAERAARQQPFRILFVGRLVPVKQPGLVIGSVRALRERGLDVEAAIIGAGSERDALRDQIMDNGLDGLVRLVGGVGQDALPAWYEWADAFCLPSRAEGVPVVLMEAMATELPVVATPVAGVPELVTHEVDGLLVDPDDPAALLEALHRLAGSASLRADMGHRGRAKVLSEFAPDVNAARLARLLGVAPE